MIDRAILFPYGDLMTLGYEKAAALLNQLGNETRLKIVRELVRAGRSGMAVGVQCMTQKCEF